MSVSSNSWAPTIASPSAVLASELPFEASTGKPAAATSFAEPMSHGWWCGRYLPAGRVASRASMAAARAASAKSFSSLA